MDKSSTYTDGKSDGSTLDSRGGDKAGPDRVWILVRLINTFYLLVNITDLLLPLTVTYIDLNMLTSCLHGGILLIKWIWLTIM